MSFFHRLLSGGEPEARSIPFCHPRCFAETLKCLIQAKFCRRESSAYGDQKHHREALPCTCAGPSPAGDSSWALAILESSCSSTAHIPQAQLSPGAHVSSISPSQDRNKQQYTDTCSFSILYITEQELKPLTIVPPTLIAIIYCLYCAM